MYRLSYCQPTARLFLRVRPASTTGKERLCTVREGSSIGIGQQTPEQLDIQELKLRI